MTAALRTEYRAEVSHLSVAPTLLTVPQVMARLNLSRGSVYNLIRSGELPSLLVRSRRRIPETVLAAFITNLTEDAA